jgi:hypothetical protein
MDLACVKDGDTGKAYGFQRGNLQATADFNTENDMG